MGHRESDPSKLDKLYTLVAEAQLVSSRHTFVAFLLLSALSYLQFASLCMKSMWKKWSNYTVKASTGITSSLKVGPSMPAETEKTWTVRSMQCFI
jgi:hypothetical protein